MTDAGRPHFLAEAPETVEARALYDDDLGAHGFVMNASRLWAHAPGLHRDLFGLAGEAGALAGLDVRRRGILVLAAAAARGDSYCALAWGGKLAERCDDALPIAVIEGALDRLDGPDRLLADWARAVVSAPNDVTRADTQRLRDAGFGDAEILAVTLYVALRLAFSTVNDALGAVPDRELVDRAPTVAAAVDFGRPPRTSGV